MIVKQGGIFIKVQSRELIQDKGFLILAKVFKFHVISGSAVIDRLKLKLSVRYGTFNGTNYYNFTVQDILSFYLTEEEVVMQKQKLKSNISKYVRISGFSNIHMSIEDYLEVMEDVMKYVFAK